MQSANTSPKKPSPLAQGSPRASPFKRADSSANRNASPSTLRGSPLPQRAPASPSPAPSSPAVSAIWSPQSPSHATRHTPTPSARITAPPSARPVSGIGATADPLARLHPAQLREMRESFQVLDRNNDGQVTHADVDDMLKQLGEDLGGPLGSRACFGGSTGTSINLSSYLNILSSLLAPMSRNDELNAAFSAFDVDDSGQIDVEDLKESLLRTAPESGSHRMTEAEIDSVIGDFRGRRALKKGMGAAVGKARGEIFRYDEFVDAIVGEGRNAAAVEEVAG